MFLRTFGNYDGDLASFESGLDKFEDDRAQQSFKDETDINTIVRRFGLTGEIPSNFRPPLEGDFAEVLDFQSALNAVKDAQASFMSLPGEVRARFGNSPQALMSFLADGKNVDEARKLGLVQAKPEVTRDVVQAVDELAAKLVKQP